MHEKFQFAKEPLRPLHARSENGEKEIKLDNFIKAVHSPIRLCGRCMYEKRKRSHSRGVSQQQKQQQQVDLNEGEMILPLRGRIRIV
jgi:hypothetical protein